MRYIVAALVIFPLITTCGQSSRVGGPCEGCEAVFEFGNKILNNVDTLPDFNDPGPKMELSGTIYQADGKTPATDVILYIYHTDQSGVYPTRGNEKGRAKRHGFIRGWVKTGSDGRYTFYTLVPKAYPGRRDPAHIHPVIKESKRNEYWIDEFLFDDDPLLVKEQRDRQQQRGGSGIVKTVKDRRGLLVARRDIVLGKNVPNYTPTPTP